MKIRDAWIDGRWQIVGGYGTRYWRENPRSYRFVSWLSWHLRHLVERPRAAWRILRGEGERDAGHGVRLALIVARGVLCALTGRIDHNYPGYPEHPLSYDLASWDHRQWSGYEMTCWSALVAAVCTGRAWHLHVYEESGP